MSPANQQSQLAKYEQARIASQLRELRSALATAREALECLRDGDHIGVPINKNCGAMRLIEDTLLATATHPAQSSAGDCTDP